MRRLLLLGLVTVGLIAAVPAAAANFTVFAGEQARRGAPEYATQNRFLPKVLNVNVGDRVTWSSPPGVHSVSFLGPRSPAGFSLYVRDPSGATYQGINDAAGNPFFFNNLRKWIYNLAGIGNSIGDIVVDDRAVHHRLVGRDVGAPRVTFRFPKVGTYKYYCVIHPGMDGRIVVRPLGANADSPREVLANALRSQGAGWGIARSLERSQPPTATIWTGIEREGVEDFLILPKTLTVKVGTKVTIQGRASADAHNVGLGPEDYLKSLIEANAFFPEGPDDPNQILPLDVYGTDQGELLFDGTNHGNGVLATPWLDRARGSPMPAASAITFTKPGTYTIYCTVHFPDMKATVVVTE